MKKLKPAPAIAIGLLILACGYFLFFDLPETLSNATPPGYCAVQQRYISDREFIRTAIRLREEDWEKWGGKVKLHQYHSGEDFDPSNPNCCRVLRGQTEPLLARLLDNQIVEVELNNETSTGDIRGPNLNDRLFFTVCGKLKGRIEYDWQGF